VSTIHATDAGQELADDQARAERVAALRRRRAALNNFGIRMVSLAIFLGIWQLAAMNVDPVLFTSPWKVAVAAVGMIASGELWADEHGPQRGDELNLVLAGRNYGWPVISYGIEYSGMKLPGGRTRQEGMEQPLYYWDPVIAPSGMIFYTGGLFPKWRDNIFVGGLGSEKLVRLSLDGDRVTGEEWLLQDLHQRIRDVGQGPDGAIYVATDGGSILRLAPRS